MKKVLIKIFGEVQGVGFRISAREMGRSLGVKIEALNQLDGSVHIEAEGEEADLEKFINWCRQGPPAAMVERVEVENLSS